MNKLICFILVFYLSSAIASDKLSAWYSPDIKKLYEQKDAQEKLESWLLDTDELIQNNKGIPYASPPKKLSNWETDPLYRRISFHGFVQNEITKSYTTSYVADELDFSDRVNYRRIALNTVVEMQAATFGCVKAPTPACLAGHGLALAKAGYNAALYKFVERNELEDRLRKNFDPAQHKKLMAALDEGSAAAEELAGLVDQITDDPELREKFKSEEGRQLIKDIANNKIQTGNYSPNAYGEEIILEGQTKSIQEQLVSAAATYYEKTETAEKYGALALQAADTFGVKVPQEFRQGFNLFLQSVSLASQFKDITNITSLNYFNAASIGLSMISSIIGKKREDPAQKRFEAIMKELNIINLKLDKVLENQERILKSIEQLSIKLDGVESRLHRTIIHAYQLNLVGTMAPYRSDINKCKNLIDRQNIEIYSQLSEKPLPELAEKFLFPTQTGLDLFDCWDNIRTLLIDGADGENWHPILLPAVGNRGKVISAEEASSIYSKRFVDWNVFIDYFNKSTDVDYSLIQNIQFPLSGNMPQHRSLSEEEKQIFASQLLLYPTRFIEITPGRGISKLLQMFDKPVHFENIIQISGYSLSLHQLVALSKLSEESSKTRVYKGYIDKYDENSDEDELQSQSQRIELSVIEPFRNLRLHLAIAKFQSSIWDGRGLLSVSVDDLSSGNLNKFKELMFVLFGDQKLNKEYKGNKLFQHNLGFYLTQMAVNNYPYGKKAYSLALSTKNIEYVDLMISPLIHEFLNGKVGVSVQCSEGKSIEDSKECVNTENSRNSTGAEILLSFDDDHSIRVPLPGWGRIENDEFFYEPEAITIHVLDDELANTMADYLTTLDDWVKIYPDDYVREKALRERNRLIVIADGAAL